MPRSAPPRPAVRDDAGMRNRDGKECNPDCHSWEPGEGGQGHGTLMRRRGRSDHFRCRTLAKTLLPVAKPVRAADGVAASGRPGRGGAPVMTCIGGAAMARPWRRPGVRCRPRSQYVARIAAEARPSRRKRGNGAQGSSGVAAPGVAAPPEPFRAVPFVHCIIKRDGDATRYSS